MKSIKATDKCCYCGGCVPLCPTKSIILKNNKIYIDKNCKFCSICVKFCPVGAIEIN